MKFCKNILEAGIEGKDIFFTYKAKIDKAPNSTGETIRLSSRKKKQLQKVGQKAFELINRPQKKFENQLWLQGISFYGLSNLILLNGIMNEFSYSQALQYYKENYDKFLKENEKLNFEQDGVKSLTNQLIKELFKDKFIQNSPNSPEIYSKYI